MNLIASSTNTPHFLDKQVQEKADVWVVDVSQREDVTAALSHFHFQTRPIPLVWLNLLIPQC